MRKGCRKKIQWLDAAAGMDGNDLITIQNVCVDKAAAEFYA